MRKIFGVLLSVLCICCAAIGLTGCKKDKHIHAFDKQVITDEYKATDATGNLLLFLFLRRKRNGNFWIRRSARTLFYELCFE